MYNNRRRSRSRSPARGGGAPARGDSRERRNGRTGTGGGRFAEGGRSRRGSTSRFYGQDPLKTLEAWKEAQHDEVELSEDQYREQYDAYKRDYMAKLEAAFFDAHAAAEWFRERYGPREVAERRADLRAWAHAEAALLAEQLRRAPANFLASVALSPQAGSDGKWAEHDAAAPPAVVGRKRGAGGGGGGAEEAFDGKAIAGHGSRCIFIRRVPAWCTRALLQATIESEMGEIGLQRLALSDAARSRDNEYTRSAWCVFATEEEARTAARRLHKALTYEQVAPAPRQFTFQAFAHRARGSMQLDKSMSYASRVAHDAEQAVALALELDEEKGLGRAARDGEERVRGAERQGLRALLADAAVASALGSDAAAAGGAAAAAKEGAHAATCARLDLACAYLRRVHMYSYYGAQQCMGEGDLLGVKTYRRSTPVMPDPEAPPPAAATAAAAAADTTAAAAPAAAPEAKEGEAAVAAAAPAAQAEEPVSAEGGEAMHVEAEGEENGGGAGGGDSAKAPQEEDESAKRAREEREAALRGDGTGERVDAAAAARMEEARGSVVAAAAELATAAAFEAAEAAQLDVWLTAHTLPEEAHARCGIKDCGKLFKDATFVHKHLKNKHAAAAEAAVADVAVPFLRAAFDADPRKPLPTVPLDIGESARGGGRDRDAPRDRRDDSRGGDWEPPQRGGGGDGGWEPRGAPREPLPWDHRDAPPFDQYRSGGGSGGGGGDFGPLPPRGAFDVPPHMRGGPPPMYMSAGPYGPRGGGMMGGRGGGRMFAGRGGGGGGAPPPPAVKHEDTAQRDPRQIVSYTDVDAPQVSAPKLDYGGVFAPPKRKKARKDAAAAAAGGAAAAAAEAGGAAAAAAAAAAAQPAAAAAQ